MAREARARAKRTSERNYVLSLVARISFVTLAAPLSYGALDTTSSRDESAVNL